MKNKVKTFNLREKAVSFPDHFGNLMSTLEDLKIFEDAPNLKNAFLRNFEVHEESAFETSWGSALYKFQMYITGVAGIMIHVWFNAEETNVVRVELGVGHEQDYHAESWTRPSSSTSVLNFSEEFPIGRIKQVTSKMEKILT